MGTDVGSEVESTPEYSRIRLYDPSDRDDFLALYETVWGQSKSPDWFDWRFAANPYRDGVQMVVAERGGELVGVEPLLPFRLRVGSKTLDAYQPVDWIVHPDHRRRGVFTQMTEYLLSEYADADLLFNFPTDVLRPGLEKFDWREVGAVPVSYRIHDPAPVRTDGASAGGSTAVNAALSAGGAVARRAMSALDRLGSAPDVEVTRHREVPVEQIARLYAANVPRRIHVPREERFLRWRFANPRWDTTTYLASTGGTPVASVVTATEQFDGFTCTHLLDVQQVTGPTETGAVTALLSAVVSDHRDVDLLKAVAESAPRALRKHWFLTDDTFPLSRVATGSTQVVRPLSPDPDGAVTRTDADGEGGGEPWRLAGRDPTDPDEWVLALADLDIA